MRRTINQTITLIVLIGLISGCSGLRPYASNHEKNLHLSTHTEASGFLAKVEAAVDIHSLDTDCARQYQGTVKLDSTTVDVGLPINTASYLSFVFESSAFLANRQSSMSYDAVLVPRDGYEYDASVSYIDNIYNVTIRERSSASGESQQLVVAPSTCLSAGG